MPKPLHFVVSYVPLLRGVAGESIEPTNEAMTALAKRIEEQPSGGADALLWGVSPEGDPWPIFVMPDANAIFEHLVEWSEGLPTTWFNLRLMADRRGYVIALVPNFEKSIERFRLAWELMHDEPLTKEAEYQLFFKPIYFVSKPGVQTTFAQVEPLLKPTMKIGFLDRSAIPGDVGEVPEDLDISGVSWIGPFELKGDDQRYLESMLPPEKSRARRKAERKARRG